MGSKCRRPPTFSFRTTADLRHEKMKNTSEFFVLNSLFPDFPILKSLCFLVLLHKMGLFKNNHNLRWPPFTPW